MFSGERSMAAGLRPVLLDLARLVYRRLPLSSLHKRHLVSIGYGLAGVLFKGTPGYEAWRGRSAPLRRTPESALSVAPVYPEEYLQGLEFPDNERPLVSIIIPTFGKLGVTATCLRSIARHAPQVAFEIIVAEDCSGDPDIELLATVPGLRYYASPRNLGFARSCNHAATLARGEFIHFLNHDTEVQEGWLEALLDTFKSWRDAGLVGSMLLYPDGRLQEAGSIVWRDGSACSFGNSQDPDFPAFNYARETDYCSSASLLIRRELFCSLGGFDERYAPAYYEDTDLAFKVRNAGYKVVYQPGSAVIHYGRASHGTDASPGMNTHQVENQKRFRNLWAPELERFHVRNSQALFLARDRSQDKRMVLVIDRYVPRPDRDAGSRSMLHIMDALIEAGFNVKFWPQTLWRDPQYAPLLQHKGIEVFYEAGSSMNFKSWIRENGRYLDCVLLSRPEAGIDYINLVRRHSRAKLIYYGIDIHHLRLRRRTGVRGPNRIVEAEARCMEELERRIWSMVDVVYYPSDQETEYVRMMTPSQNSRTVPLFGLKNFAPPEDGNLSRRRDILFVAGFGHDPNEDAALWFTREVLPLIWRHVPDVRLLLVGSNPTQNVRELSVDPAVTVTGFVTDTQLAGYYANARVAIAPLRYGAGMKGKVIEAMQFGVPIVTTPVGVEGMSALEPKLPVHAQPLAFAQAVLALLTDDVAWRRQRLTQSEYVRENFSHEALQEFLAADLGDARRKHLAL